MKFWAHSDPDGLAPDAPDSRWQLLSEHLENVARLAKRLAQDALPDHKHFHELAEWCGLLHDYGKYTECFQRMIVEKQGKCPHAIHGAALAHGGALDDKPGLCAPHIAAAIAGHHAGMPDSTELLGKANQARNDALALFARAASDCASIGLLFNGGRPKLEHVGARFDLLTRMLLSCLVDADRLDTAGRPVIQAPLAASDRLGVLLKHLERLADATPDGVVKTARAEVLSDCLAAASASGRIFSLSVPTGGGKTLAGMAFALKRATLYPEYRRVIVVIPYLSIIEQNADVYASVFGRDSILEHRPARARGLKQTSASRNYAFCCRAPRGRVD